MLSVHLSTITEVNKSEGGYAVQFLDRAGAMVTASFQPTEESLASAIAAREHLADVVRTIEGRMCAECRRHAPDTKGPHPALCSNCSCDKLNAAGDAARPAERSWGDFREMTPRGHLEHHKFVAKAEQVFTPPTNGSAH